MMPVVLDPRAVASALRGAAYGNRVSAPGPGHSPADRSLSVTLDPNAPDGFRVRSFADDDWKASRDYVRAAIGLPTRTRCRRAPRPIAAPASRRSSADQPVTGRTAAALKIWRYASPVRGTLGECYLHQREVELDLDVASVMRFH